ncbi:MAG: outer membrane lipid asymmetry maintenance protein MlaD [Neisseriaceae bacterium]|nr:outer membrane lipid asymmetry maintenance protein MlaD [Neisseriaceae bacterium]
MKQSTLELWVGFFVAISIAALVFLSLQVAGRDGGMSKTTSYTVYAEFDDIGGLKVKAPVRTAGVVVGRVANIQLNKETFRAKVALELSDAYHFSSDVSAQILTSGILGEQYIGLQEGGEEETLNAGDTITMTSSAMVLENLIGKFMTAFADKQDSSTSSEK